MNKQVDLEAATKKSSEHKVRLDSGTLKSLKHDVSALKQIADLRQKTQVHASGWQGGVIAERREGLHLFLADDGYPLLIYINAHRLSTITSLILTSYIYIYIYIHTYVFMLHNM